MLFIKDGRKKRYEVQAGKVLCTIQIDGRWVSNPTLEQVLADGWEEYTPPQPPAPQPYVPSYDELYKQRIVELVRGKYDIDDELAILRQRESKPEQFNEYNEFVEQCKVEAHEYAESQTHKTE